MSREWVVPDLVLNKRVRDSYRVYAREDETTLCPFPSMFDPVRPCSSFLTAHENFATYITA